MIRSAIEMDEEQVAELERLAAYLKVVREQEDSWSSPSGVGDRVSGIQVVGPAGEIKKEWHDE